MKLACSVEVVRHCMDLKARVALKTDRSVFKARSKMPKIEFRNCFCPQSKKQKAFALWSRSNCGKKSKVPTTKYE